MRFALGFSVHTGWAAVVAVDERGQVELRRRVRLTATAEEGEFFHAAREMPLADAAGFLAASERDMIAAATGVVSALLAELAPRLVVAAGVVVGNGKLPGSLEAIVRSHPLVHAAEGDLFRRVFGRASADLGLAVTTVRVRDLAGHERISRPAGSPWGKDEKDAAVAALLALETANRGARKPVERDDG